MKLLEVIVTSADEAREAEDGGADRLELVRARKEEGLTPTPHVIEEVLGAVSIPVRVMLRNAQSFAAGSTIDIECLRKQAALLASLPVDGLVLGFLKNGEIDFSNMRFVLAASGDKPVTFHRALEWVADPLTEIESLKMFPQIDRILINGGEGSWAERRERLEQLQRKAEPAITVIAGGGLTQEGLLSLRESDLIREFHAGSAARDAQGKLLRDRVCYLRRILDGQRMPDA